MTITVTTDGLTELIVALRADGRTVIGPVVRDGVITHAEIQGADDLPQGWTEEQEAGQYRLEPTGTDERFAFSSPSTSWKRQLYPERTLLVRSQRRDGELTIEQPAPEATPTAFFGIRSCDVAALGVLDRVLLDPDATDPTYAAHRADTFIVAVACNHPGNTCFCASMDTGPTPSTGFDLAVRELPGPRYLIVAGTDRGTELLARIGADQATETDEHEAAAAHDHAVAAMGRRLDPADPPRAALAPDHPRWDDVAERCLTCANCTMVCPTCFCSTTADTTDLTGQTAERWRIWDSCFTLDFSYLHGGAVRSSTKQRYRQWLLHKLVTWHDQFDTSGCVGCGRCITWCPVGIDLTAEIAALASGTDPGGIP
ncbi:MAG: 4Fe-4S dicluster domain-containing protein [Acidimicrobiia bacterium]|nr:4Fe-4S dicluster domain-containing protein [Acidimicrobiia bacterium]